MQSLTTTHPLPEMSKVLKLMFWPSGSQALMMVTFIVSERSIAFVVA